MPSQRRPSFGLRCCERAWYSGDHVFVLCCEKEFKRKMNNKQESARFIKAKVHILKRGMWANSERESCEDVLIPGFCSCRYNLEMWY